MSKTGQSLETLRYYIDHFIPANTSMNGEPLDMRGAAQDALAQLTDRITAPIPMYLTCPKCSERHIDEGDFRTKPHHTHSCQHCGLTWRPAIVHTVGVEFLPGFKNDPAPVAATASDPERGVASISGSFAEGLAAMGATPVTSTSPAWYPTENSWVRLKTDGTIARLGAFSKLTGRFTADTLDGQIRFYPRSTDLERWIPRITERVRLRGAVYGTVCDNGLEPTTEGLPFFMVRIDGERVDSHRPCKAYLNDLQPALPAYLAKPTSFQPGDWVRVLNTKTRRVREIQTRNGIDWIVLDGDLSLFDPANLTRWVPREGERVVHLKSQIGTTVRLHSERLFLLANPIGGREWFELSELEPFIEKATRLDYLHSLENALRTARALLQCDAFAKSIDDLLDQGGQYR